MPLLSIAQPSTVSVPIDLVLQTECGARKGEVLTSYRQRPLSWCVGTRLMAAFTDTSALAGRRLYVTFDLAPEQAQAGVLPFMVAVSSFTASGLPAAHIGASFQIVQQTLVASVYVPREAASAYVIVSSPPFSQGDQSLTIRDVQAHVSTATFEPGQMCAPCRPYLDDAMDRVRRQFLFADRLQLDAMDRALRVAATGAAGIGDMDGTMKELARQLGEASMAAGVMPHGHYQTSAEYAALAAATNPALAGTGTREVPATAQTPATVQTPATKQIPAAVQTPATRQTPPIAQSLATPQSPATPLAGAALFDTTMLDNQVGLVRLRTFLEADMAAGATYAHALRDAIVVLHRQGARQWILDLRSHQGGTLAPVVAALRPLLGKGAVGYVVDAAGQRQNGWVWGDSELPVGVAGSYFTKESPSFDASDQAVAVLFGPATMSTAEMLAIAFHGRPRSRSFGQPSGGATTIVSGRRDQYGNFLGIASGYSADRHGQRIFPKVLPDLVVDQPPAGANAGDHAPDLVLAAAREWLQQEQQRQQR